MKVGYRALERLTKEKDIEIDKERQNEGQKE